MGQVNFGLAATEWGESDTNPADIEEIAGGNGKIDVVAFDDTTEEEVQTYIKLPATLDTAGNVTFKIDGFAATATGNPIRLNVSHSAKGDSEDWDTAYDDDNSGDQVTDAVQDDYDFLTFTVSVATLGWAANDEVRLKLIRVAIGAGSKLVGDWYCTNFRIELPTL